MGCNEAEDFILQQLESKHPYYRWLTLGKLAESGGRRYRQIFIRFHLNDTDVDVRQKALLELCDLFRGENDLEKLALALRAFDDPTSDIETRLAAGAVMMYQLNVPNDEYGGPGWWNGEEDDLQHPSILEAVKQTRLQLTDRPLWLHIYDID